MPLESPRRPLLPPAFASGHRRLAVLGAGVALAGALAYTVVIITHGPVLWTDATGGPATGARPLTVADPQGFTYTLTAHHADESAIGDPQNPVSPAPPGLDYVVISATLTDTTPERPAPGDLSRAGLYLEVPLADIAAAIKPSAFPTGLSTAQFLHHAGCSDLATFLPHARVFTSGYILSTQDAGYGYLWQSTADNHDCLIPLLDGSVLYAPHDDGPGTMPAGSGADGNYVGLDPLPASIPEKDLRLATASPQGSGWATGQSVPLTW